MHPTTVSCYQVGSVQMLEQRWQTNYCRAFRKKEEYLVTFVTLLAALSERGAEWRPSCNGEWLRASSYPWCPVVEPNKRFGSLCDGSTYYDLLSVIRCHQPAQANSQDTGGYKARPPLSIPAHTCTSRASYNQVTECNQASSCRILHVIRWIKLGRHACRTYPEPL